VLCAGSAFLYFFQKTLKYSETFSSFPLTTTMNGGKPPPLYTRGNIRYTERKSSWGKTTRANARNHHSRENGGISRYAARRKPQQCRWGTALRTCGQRRKRITERAEETRLHRPKCGMRTQYELLKVMLSEICRRIKLKFGECQLKNRSVNDGSQHILLR